MFPRLVSVVTLLIATIAVVLFGMSQASTAGRWHKMEHRYVCHPTNGQGNLHNGWDLIRPADASSHINEALYPNGHYWKHESKDGRHDVYAVGRTCPTPTSTPTPTPTETVTPTPTGTVSVTPTPTTTPTSGPTCPPLPEAHFVRGTHRSDVLTGTDCRDVILGHGGDDTMYGLAGVDTIVGGRGNDRLVGGPDGDILRGGLGRDTCVDAHRTIFISCERIRYTD